MSTAYQNWKTNRPARLPEPIRGTLDNVRRLLGRFVLSQTIVYLLIWVIVSFWIFGWIDYLPAWMGAAESPRWVRIGMLVLLGLGSLIIFYQQIWRRWSVRWNDSSLALLIERRYPDFQSALITTVQANQPSQLSFGSHEHPNRSGVLEIAKEKAIELIETVNPQSLIRLQLLQRQMVILALALVCSITLAMFYPQWSWHWSKRLFSLSNEAWPRNCLIAVEGIEFEVPTFTGMTNRKRYLLSFQDSEVKVPRGQSGLFKSYASLAAKQVPEICTLYYRDEEGNRGRANLRRLIASDGKQNFALEGPPVESISQSMTLNLVGGDARVSDLRMQAVDSPFVAELQIRVLYPEYLRRSTQSRWGEETMPYRTGLRLPQGTELAFVVEASKPIRKCEFIIVRGGKETDGENREKELVFDSPEKTFSIPMGKLDSNILFEVRLWDSDGICSSRVQQFVVSSLLDQTPQADMVLDGIGSAITEIAAIPVLGKVRDEYDVARVWIETVLDEKPPLQMNLDLNSEGQVQAVIDCKAMKDSGVLETKVGSTLALTLSASDYFDLENQPHIGRANTVQLSIVTPDQLLLILDRREAAMRKRMESIIGEISQLRDVYLSIARHNKEDIGDANKPSTEDNSNQAENANGTNGTEKDKSDVPISREEQLARSARLQLLRSQQALSQVSKSFAELTGVEKEIDQISRELVNNRIDSVDRRTRWQEKIKKPLHDLLDKPWGEFDRNAKELEKLLLKSEPIQSVIEPAVQQLIEQNTAIYNTLQSILADMLEIQDQTAIVDMLRGIIDSSGELIDETKGLKKNQDRKALELLK